jgi:hypothetical protein
MHRLEARSIRVGEIRLEDIQAQIEPPAGDLFEVLALDARSVPVIVPLTFTEKWNARCWTPQLACPRCGLPSRRLRDQGAGFCCARCGPRLTVEQRLKRTRFWVQGGRETVAVVKASAGGSRTLASLTTSLARGLMVQANTALSLALAALECTDDMQPGRDAA